ncbi:MAG: hypothetical protein A2Y41_00205 [Spirochaetes bacterium GWB1_36_13]|nr:MAG: hypothetical protein A2Y41_00205 [Spirochaetes bacterium GWB1_36_13]
MSDERRKFLRVKKSFPFNYNIRGEKEIYDAETADISLGGIGYICSENLAINKIIHMRMHIPGFNEPMSIRGIIRWKKDLGQGKYFLGVEFYNIEQEEKDLILKALREG